MKYITTPLHITGEDSDKYLTRKIETNKEMLDSLIELIVFTPKGSFLADPDFGFEYWTYEFSNIRYREFNSGHTATVSGDLTNEMTLFKCKNSIIHSLKSYAPQLNNVSVSILLDMPQLKQNIRDNISSKYAVTISVTGNIEDNSSTVQEEYRKDILFFVEPTVKRVFL